MHTILLQYNNIHTYDIKSTLGNEFNYSYDINDIHICDLIIVDTHNFFMHKSKILNRKKQSQSSTLPVLCFFNSEDIENFEPGVIDDFIFLPLNHKELTFRINSLIQNQKNTNKVFLENNKTIGNENYLGINRKYEASNNNLENVDLEYNILASANSINDNLSTDPFVKNETGKENYMNIESNLNFQLFFKQSAVGVSIVDINTGVIIKANQRFCDLLKYSIDELLNLTFHDITFHEDIIIDLENVEKVLRGEIREYNIEKRYIRKDRKIIWAELSVFPMWEEGEKPNYLIGITQDIDAQKKSQEELIGKETLFRTMMDYTLSWETFRDKNGKVLYVSQGFEKITGHSLEDYKNKAIKFKDFIHPDDAELVLNNFNQALANKQTIENLEYRVIKKDKSIVYVTVSYQPVFSNDEEFLGIRTSIRDITKRKEIEEALKESEENFRRFVDHTLSWETFLDKNENVIYISQGFEKITGYSIDEYREGKIKFKNFIFREDLEIVLNEFYNALYHKKILENFEYRIIKKDGSKIYVSVSSQPVYSENNEFLGIHTSVKDITERKIVEKALIESEFRFRKLFEQAAVGVVQAESPTGRFIQVNQKYSDIVGYSIDELLNMHIRDIAYPEDLDKILESFNNLMQGKTKEYSEKVRYVKKDGSILWVNRTVSPMWKAGEYPNFHIAIVQDITEQVIAEEKVKKYSEELKELNDTKDKFFSIIAHDLRGSIGNFVAYLDFLTNDKYSISNEQTQQYLNILKKSSKTTFNLLENLLTWARSQTGRIDFKPKENNLYDLIKANLDLFSSIAENKKIILINGSEINQVGYFDSSMIDTVLRNLINNAIKYTKEYGIILISVKETSVDLSVSVKDTGIGMAQSVSEGIFRIDMKRFSIEGTDGEKGSGLGLILCKEFIEKHGGTISVKSEPDVGSEFIFTIPKPYQSTSMYISRIVE